MLYPGDRKLFTAKDVTRACGISRATLLRMEESGFLTPYRIDPGSGYRYYDTGNIAAIGQYIIGFGEYSVIPELWRRLFEEVEALGLEPCGPQRLIGLVAPYVGEHVPSDEYCYECVIPIEA